MTIVFLLLAALSVGGVLAAMSLRNAIHCILALTIGFVGLAGLYLELGAQFAGFTQILVYVGAVAILAVFALMMTRSDKLGSATKLSATPLAETVSSVAVTAGVFGVLAWAVHSRSAAPVPPAPSDSVSEIGVALMHPFLVPLEMIGVLLTAALLGAVIVAMPSKRGKP